LRGKFASAQALRYQIVDVHNALTTLAEREKRYDPDIAHGAVPLSQQLKDFSSLVSLVIWYDVLFQINAVSKSMQRQNFDVCKSVELLEGCHEFLTELKANSLQRAISAAMELANDLQVESEFQSMKTV
jgi:hypothetical protein